MAHSPTTFYSASAGSGKTYTLARNYLTLLFKNDFNNGYREILAITFTNKAVAEMKERILENLHALTKQEITGDLEPIRNHIKEATGLDNEQLRHKAIKIERKLLHDYAAFDIVTIDSFNHRILRTFAREVDLPDGFEIEMDSDRLISKAIHNLLARAGDDKQLTKLLVDFSISKIDEGKSWDIEFDLNKIAQLIKSESHYTYLQQLKSKSLTDFLELRKQLSNHVKNATDQVFDLGKQLYDNYTSQGLTITDFKGKSKGIYPWIQKIATGELPKNTKPKYLQDALHNSVASDKTGTNAAIVDSLQHDLVKVITSYQQNVGLIQLYNNALSKITSLSLLNQITQEIDLIKKEEQIVPIYEFNGILSKQIKDEPAPFIYERLGEKYRHYFIDEFQDTSTMQWENLMPLIENPLVQIRDDGTRGSLMLVGDAKQAIYRWRGGDADQFLNILGSKALFLQEKQNETLGVNWRSYDRVIHFNNDFFEFYGTHLKNDLYQELYLKYLKQDSNPKKGGYLQIDLLNTDKTAASDSDEPTNEIYPIHTKRQIDQALQDGFAPHEICVLVRKKKQGDEIAQYLVQQDMNVVSSDSLLVGSSPKVQLLTQFMRMCLFPQQQEPRYNFLLQFAVWKDIPQIQSFIENYLHLSLSDLCKQLLGVDDDMDLAFAKAPLFQATEKVAAALGLLEDHDTRLQAFLEYIYEWGTGYEKSAASFLEAWESKQNSLSVPAAEDPTAVQIMTIHKSKGLEFPVVIVPYCDELLESLRDATGWFPVMPADYNGFDHLFISLKKEGLDYPSPGPEMYTDQLAKSQMDQINTLYVAFTRAKEQLYISCFNNEKPKENYGNLLKQFVEKYQWNQVERDEFISYSNGSSTRVSKPSMVNESILIDDYFTSDRTDRAAISTRKGVLWASDSIEAINAGNQLHYYLSLCQDRSNIKEVSKAINRDRSIDRTTATQLIATIEKIMSHPDLVRFYEVGVKALNERAILSKDSKAIPDRLVFNQNEVTIMDYKTGAEQAKHQQQLNRYASLLQEMGYQVAVKILIYTDDLKILSWQ